MAKLPVSPYWSANPNIPIYLDTGDGKRSPEPEENSHHICPTCETSSRDQPIHCVSVASPAPPSYTSNSPPAPPLRSPRNLAVPVLNVETSRRWSAPRPPRPALRFSAEGRPQLRFRPNASPISPQHAMKEKIDWSRKSCIGLGIPDAQFRPDSSPLTPGTVEARGDQTAPDLGGASNFAQRIEQKLWKYSASGNVAKRWLLEIISWSLSALCMAGIIIMLLVYKNRRIPNWPLGLTLNAYISVLSKVASAALLLPVSEGLGQLKWSWFQGDNSKKMWDFEIFDNASRGPWGSLLLLVRTKGRSMAALGAAVTIFALALDPFFQQVVEYPEKWRIQQETGSIPMAMTYQPYHAGTEYREGTENLELDQNMMGITHHYFYDQGTAPVTFGKGYRAEIPLACPNSNCTWPAYETLGICNKCEDVSDLLDYKCVNTTLDWVQVPDENEDGEVAYPNGTSCGWYLRADDPLLMVGHNIDNNTAHAGEVLLMRTQPLYDIFSREPIPGYPSRVNISRNPLAHVIIASGRELSNIQENVAPFAHECILSWCVKKMLSEYSDGSYAETVTKTFINDTLGPSPWTIEEVVNENDALSGTLYYYNENITLAGESEVKYHVNNSTQLYTLSLFDDIFPSTYILANSTNMADAILRYKEYITIGPYTRNLTYNPFLYNNISKHLDNLATAMTNIIRSSASGTEMLSGPSYDQESFVDVRWAWLTLPLGLLGLTFIFLVTTIVRSSIEQEHVGVWKTSAIATLLYGLPDEMQKRITSNKDSGTPRAKAKEMKVKWLPRAGWRFSGNSTYPTTSSSNSPDTPRRSSISFPKPQSTASLVSNSTVSFKSDSSTLKESGPNSPSPRWI